MTESKTSMSRHPAVAVLAKVVFLLGLLGFGLFTQLSKTLESGNDRIMGDFGDARLINAQLEHSFLSIFRDWPTTFWTAPSLFFPFPDSFAMSDVMTGGLLLYAPVRWTGLDPQSSFQVWILLCTLTNFAAMLVLARMIGANFFGSVFAAFFFAFALPRANLMLHAQLLPEFYSVASVIFLVAAHRLNSKAKVGREGPSRGGPWMMGSLGVGAGLMLVAQFWTAFYLGWFFCFTILTFGIAVVAFPKGRRALRVYLNGLKVFIGAFVTVTAAGLAPMALRYFAMARTMGRREWGEVFAYIPNFQNIFFHPWVVDAIGAEWAKPRGESTVFFGLSAMGLGVWLMVRRMKRFRGQVSADTLATGSDSLAFYLALTCFIMLFTAARWPTGSTPWWVVFSTIPGASAIRAVSRFVVVLLIPVSLMIGLGITMLSNEFRGRKRWAVPLLLMGLITLENYKYVDFTYSKSEHFERVGTLKGRLDKLLPCDVFYSIPRTDEAVGHTDAIWLSLTTGIPTINGYSGGNPPQYRHFAAIKSKDEMLDALHAWTRRWGVEVPRGRLCVIEDRK